MIEKGILWYGYEVFYNGKFVGKVIIGMQLLILGKNVGFVLIVVEVSEIGIVVEVEICKKLVKVKVVKILFYKC